MKKKIVSLALASMLALTVCGGAALASFEPASSPAENVLYCHGGGHHGGSGHHGGGHHHGKGKACDWLFHACGDCVDVNCTDEDHTHRCPADCDDADHHHYGVCRYSDGTYALTQPKKA